MNAALLYAAAGCLLAVLGLGGVVLLDQLLRRILACNIMGSGIFLVLVGLAQRDGTADPVPQAMVLTGIVVTVAATALALTLTRRWHALSGTDRLPDTPDTSRKEHD